MTKETALEIIKAYRDRLTGSCSNQLDNDIQAFDLAIQALKQEPVEAEWIDLHFPAEYYAPEFQCSRCGGKNHWSNYCPKCGAIMVKAVP